MYDHHNLSAWSLYKKGSMACPPIHFNPNHLSFTTTFLLVHLLIECKINPESSWDSNPRPSEYYSDALTIKPLGPLAEEQETSYISSIA